MSNYAIYFSPTNGTKKITKLLASELGAYTEIDLSKTENEKNRTFEKDDICIIGVPSYGGRVPAVALERMEEFQGNSAKVVLIAVYGNRAYEDTFVELQDFLTKRNFCSVAAVAAIAEHSVMHQFAKGRPDENDKKELIQYAREIKSELENNKEFTEIQLPGEHPYKEYNGIPIKPKANKKCTKCGACAETCPVGAIPMDAPNTTNTDICISCMRCISVCPKKARKVNGLMVKVATLKMKKNCTVRKHNELFIGRNAQMAKAVFVDYTGTLMRE